MDQLQKIQSKIYEIRGQRVMLDFDLAALYHVTTGNLNKAVKRNIKRFPPDFMFQLTKEEFLKLKSSLIFQIGISNDSTLTHHGITSTGRGGTRTLPYAFTENGVAMLSVVTGDRYHCHHGQASHVGHESQKSCFECVTKEPHSMLNSKH